MENWVKEIAARSSQTLLVQSGYSLFVISDDAFVVVELSRTGGEPKAPTVNVSFHSDVDDNLDRVFRIEAKGPSPVQYCLGRGYVNHMTSGPVELRPVPFE